MARNVNAPMNPALAYALMPRDSFAQRRADNLMALQVESMRQQSLQQQLAEKQAALAETQQTLSSISAMDLLPASKRRLNEQFTERWRGQMQRELDELYGGDIMRFKRERQPYLKQQFAKELLSSSEFNAALENKKTYGLVEKAREKGREIVGDFDTTYRMFELSPTEVRLSYDGDYEAPKDVWEHFDKTPHAIAPYGVKGKPVPVSESDVLAQLMSRGLSRKQASDYLTKSGYQGGRYWKMEQQKPWEAEKQAFDQAVDKERLRLSWDDNRRGWATLEETKAENRRRDAREGGGVGPNGATVGDIIFDWNVQDPNVKTSVDEGGNVTMMKSGMTGKLSEGIETAIGLRDRDFVSENSVRKAFRSDVREVFSVDGKTKYTPRSGGTHLFESIDASTVYRGRIDGKMRNYIRGQAFMGGQNREVIIPLPEGAYAKTGVSASKPLKKGTPTPSTTPSTGDLLRQQQEAFK